MDSCQDSATVNLLLEQIGRGSANISAASDLARVMKSECKSNIPALDALASIGASGRCSNNNERDLHRWLRGMRGLQLETYEITLELQAS